MKKEFIYILLGLVSTGNVHAQRMPDVVRNMPDSILPLLTKNDRLDFVDYLDSNMKAEVTNKFGGKSEMTIVTNDYAHIKMTGSSDVSFKLLPNGGDSIICVVQTFTSGVASSVLKFYTKEWEVLPSKAFVSIPPIKDFFSFPETLGKAEQENLINKIDVCFVKAEFVKDSNDLAFALTTPNYLSEEDRESMAKFLKQSVTLNWNGERFE